ncbi:hypothetical protein [Mesorhizobium comanense]|uniref:hypothetical protein n=1 Tax=Mesorhizobium comanense TaxID=2502215 RepID=UPI0010F4CAC2|nr:hypothetical protein [Mesorhizobium comanense]
MTDMPTSAPITSRHSNLQRLSVPVHRIAASLIAMSAVLGAALKMAYVEPYTGQGRRPRALPDDDLEGRDPTW